MTDQIQYKEIGNMQVLLVAIPTVEDAIRVLATYKQYNPNLKSFIGEQYAHAVWNAHYKEHSVFMFRPGKVPAVFTKDPGSPKINWYRAYKSAEISLEEFYILYFSEERYKGFWRALDKLERKYNE